MDYEYGLEQLKKLAQNTPSWLRECHIYEARLQENLSEERRYGTTEQTRSDRMKILDGLNILSYQIANCSFNDLCRKMPLNLPKAITHQPDIFFEKPDSTNVSVRNTPISQSLSEDISSPLPSTKMIFISCSSKDRTYLEELRAHVTDYIREGKVVCWDDEEINPVTIWRKEREKDLRAANMAILLVSIDFLKSDFLLQNELPYLLTSAKAKKMNILCVLVRPCSFQETELARFQTANLSLQPLNTMDKTKRDEIWMKVAENIKKHLTLPKENI